MASSEAKKKLTAVFVTDVVGYSRLMGDDHDATVKTLSTYREVFSSHIQKSQGRVVNAPGDSILAEFESVVDAVSCAVEIQRELAERNAELSENRQMRFRIGVNLGDVLIKDGELFGDGVNIAARLELLADPGGVCISRTVYDQVHTRLELEYDYLGEHRVKNVSTPVRVYKVLLEPGQAPTRFRQAIRTLARSRRKITLGVVAAVVVVLVAVLAWNLYRQSVTEAALAAFEREAALPLPDRPSIAVLPFQNLSGDPEQDYFADGIVEDLITDLSKISGLFVIARNSTFTYKGQQVKVRQVAEELGVRYVLEGSVRRASERVRINAQLIDATTGGHLWAERYDGTLADVFALQDRVTERIVSALAVKLTIEDRKVLEHSDRPLNLDAYEYVLRGRAKLAQANRQATLKARALFEKAIEADPKYARAYVNLGLLHYHEWRYWGLDRDRNTSRALKRAREAIMIDDASTGAHVLLALVLQLRGEHEAADREADRVLAMGGQQSETLGNLGGYLWRASRAREAVDILVRAIRLDPLHSPDWLMWLGASYLESKAPEKAVSVLERAVKRAPDYVAVHLFLAISYATLDRMEAARAQMKEVLRINPRFSIEAFVKYAGHHRLDEQVEIMARIGFPAHSRK